jgi:hypothetical protein
MDSKRQRMIQSASPGKPFSSGALFMRTARAEDTRSNGPVDRGQRVSTCGHSFHAFIAGILVLTRTKSSD